MLDKVSNIFNAPCFLVHRRQSLKGGTCFFFTKSVSLQTIEECVRLNVFSLVNLTGNSSPWLWIHYFRWELVITDSHYIIYLKPLSVYFAILSEIVGITFTYIILFETLKVRLKFLIFIGLMTLNSDYVRLCWCLLLFFFVDF